MSRGLTSLLRCRVRQATRLVESLEPRKLLSAGALDPTFGTNGIELFNTGLNLKLKDAAVQTDGKIIVLFSDAGFTSSALARFNADGTLDSTFGGGLISGAGLGQFKSYSALAIQSDGKIILAGTNGTVEVTRFLTDGSVDSTFGSGGAASISSATDSYGVTDVLVRPDDRIVVGGNVTSQSKPDSDFALFALSANGKTDSAFNNGSPVVATDILGGDDSVDAIALFNNGRIVASGTASDSQGKTVLAIALYGADGQLDKSFDGDGRLTSAALTPAAAPKLAIQNGTRIVLLDPGGPQISVARFTPTGALDPSFGNGTGLLSPVNTVPIGSLFGGAIAVEPTGQIIVAYDAARAAGDAARLVRLNPDGSTDTTFNDPGVLASAGFAGSSHEALLGPNHTVLIATAITNNDVVLARFDASHAPKASASGPLVGDATANTLSIPVTYLGETAIDPASVAAGNVRLDGPNGYSQPASSFANVAISGNTLTVTYFFPPPGGTVDPGDNGQYQVSTQPAGVKDADGNAPAASVFGTFNLTIKAALADLAFSDTTFAAGTYFAGDSIGASLTPTVVGRDVGSFGVEVALSSDNIAGNGDDIPILSTNSATSGTTFTSLGPIPAGVPVGNYFLIAVLDPTGQIAEVEKSNNTMVSSTASITIAAHPPVVPSLTIGGLDPSFGVAGISRQALGFTSTVGTREQPDGKLLIAGFASPGTIGLARIQADGVTRDSSFGDANGVTLVNFRGTSDRPVDFDLLPDGKILVAGTSTAVNVAATADSNFFVTRFNADGGLDTTFGAAGWTFIDFAADAALMPSTDTARDLLVANDGKILVAGRTNAGGNADFALTRLDADGALDPTFGTAGKTTTDFAGGDDGAQALAQAANGSIVASGFATVGGAKQIAVAQYLGSGVLDRRFGKGGLATATAGGTDEQANAVAISSKGQIVVAGYTATGSIVDQTYASAFAVARFSSRGKMDSKFGNRGVATKTLAAPATATSVEVAADGRIVASGVQSSGISQGLAGERDIAIVRFSDRGLLDGSFGQDGVVVISTGVGTVSSAARTDTPRFATASHLLAPLAAASAAETLNDFQNSAEGKLSNRLGGGAFLAGTSGAQSVVAALVTSGVELSGELIANLPPAVIGGAKGSLAVSVANLGDVLAQGAIDITFYTSADQTLGSGDREFSVLTGKALKLKPLTVGGKAKKIKLKFVYPTDILDGSYYILAVVNASGTIHELNPNNDSAFTDRPIQISPPAVDLTGPALPGGLTFSAGRPATMPITLSNDGNVALKRTIGLSIFLSIDATFDTDDLSLGAPLSAKVNLKRQTSRVVKVKLTPLAQTTGDFYLFVVIDPTNQVAERNESNNLLASSLTSRFKFG